MSPESAPPPAELPRTTGVFIGPFGLRAGWRMTLFLLLFAALSVAAYLPLVPLQPLLGPDSRRLANTFLAVVAVLAATAIMARVDRRAFASYGLGTVHRWRNLFTGMAAGFVALSGLMGLLAAAGAYRFDAGDIQGAAVWPWAGYWTVFFLCVGLMEELTTRGYALFALSQGMGFWPSAVLLSVLFGLGHLGNSGEHLMGIANAAMAGLAFAFGVWWTGTLWWAIGAHMMWDWAESFFYGVADSGIRTPHHFLTGSPDGAAWLSGGTAGPEGSALCGVALALLAASVCITAPRYRAPELERRRRPRPEPPVPEAEQPAAVHPEAPAESLHSGLPGAEPPKAVDPGSPRPEALEPAGPEPPNPESPRADPYVG
ncbi:MAG TPA: CPBP family glutamic-type intramembrane protease [Bryobacteraceae bacterium]|jgi:hypothetical protein